MFAPNIRMYASWGGRVISLKIHGQDDIVKGDIVQVLGTKEHERIEFFDDSGELRVTTYWMEDCWLAYKTITIPKEGVEWINKFIQVNFKEK